MATETPSEVASRSTASISAKNKRHVGRWIALLFLLTLIVWLMASNHPFAQGIRSLAGSKPDQTILEKSFTLGPRSFRYYRFELPQGSTNVSIVGDFTVVAINQSGAANSEEKSDADASVEVYLLGETAFAAWQTGSSVSSIYESGKKAQGKMRADLPTGAGIYYLVFSNKFSPTTAKSINATFSTHYKSWLPDWFRKNQAR